MPPFDNFSWATVRMFIQEKEDLLVPQAHHKFHVGSVRPDFTVIRHLVKHYYSSFQRNERIFQYDRAYDIQLQFLQQPRMAGVRIQNPHWKLFEPLDRPGVVLPRL